MKQQKLFIAPVPTSHLQTDNTKHLRIVTKWIIPRMKSDHTWRSESEELARSEQIELKGRQSQEGEGLSSMSFLSLKNQWESASKIKLV